MFIPIALAVLVAGLLLYFLAPGKFADAGRIMFIVGLCAIVYLTLGGHVRFG